MPRCKLFQELSLSPSPSPGCSSLSLNMNFELAQSAGLFLGDEDFSYHVLRFSTSCCSLALPGGGVRVQGRSGVGVPGSLPPLPVPHSWWGRSIEKEKGLEAPLLCCVSRSKQLNLSVPKNLVL